MTSLNDEGLIAEKFSSYDDFRNFLKSYEEKNFIQVFVSHSRTIESARKRGVKGLMKEELKYSEIVIKCIHSGYRKSKSTGQRPMQSTFRKQCPFFIRLKAKENFLKVVAVKEDHNHAHNERTSAFLPRQRIHDEHSKDLRRQLLLLRANNKLLQTKLQSASSEKVTFKDLHNLACNSNSDNSLETALSYLLEKENASVEVIKSEENNLLCIFYQDYEMKCVFSMYPEVLFIDVIHKVCDQCMTLYILLIKDANGESEIVGFYLVTSEDKATMKQLSVQFKKHNPAWCQIKSIMTDKDFVERVVFKEEFPNARLLICLFHTLQAFCHQITSENMSITSSERDSCLEILIKMAYSTSKDLYDKYVEELEDLHLNTVTEYFKLNWHPICNEWVIGLQELSGITLNNRTNNRLQSINSKLVQVVKSNSKITELFQSLDNCLLSLRAERDSRVAKISLKVPLVDYSAMKSFQVKYMKTLTPYAYNIVVSQIQKKDLVQLLEKHIDGSFTIVSKSGCLYKVTHEKCSCAFFVSMNLVCKHILKVREASNMDLFCTSLFGVRWTKEYYLNTSLVLVKSDSSTFNESSMELDEGKTEMILSEHKKFKLVHTTTQSLATLASEVPARIFMQRLQVLNTIKEMWSKGSEVSVVKNLNSDNIPNEFSEGDSADSEGALKFEVPVPENINSKTHATNTTASNTKEKLQTAKF